MKKTGLIPFVLTGLLVLSACTNTNEPSGDYELPTYAQNRVTDFALREGIQDIDAKQELAQQRYNDYLIAIVKGSNRTRYGSFAHRHSMQRLARNLAIAYIEDFHKGVHIENAEQNVENPSDAMERRREFYAGHYGTSMRTTNPSEQTLLDRDKDSIVGELTRQYMLRLREQEKSAEAYR